MYFIFDSAGAKTGPFSKEDIALFVGDGRLHADTDIEEAESGRLVKVSSVVGSMPPPVQPAPQATYQPQYEQPPMAPKKSNTGLIITIVVIAVLCSCFAPIAAVLFPVFSQAKQAAKKTQALSNIKQVATSIMIYQADWDDRFPTEMGNGRSLEKQVMPYLKSTSLFSVMGTRIESNPTLAGKEAKDIPDLSNTIMLWAFPPALKDKAPMATADSAAYMTDRNALELAINSGRYQRPTK
ncbi:MAG: hypothetical protein KF836_13810 [Fimbriimonadaceae bacterium]|nr:hypothetical protein [Fimbriimonadaceae bacterium]